MAKDAHIHGVMSYYSHSNISLRNLEKAAQMINKTPGAIIKLPTTHRKLKKSIKPVYCSEIHIECSRCKMYTATETNNVKKVQCSKCKMSLCRNKSNYFLFIPFEQQLETVIVENLDKIMKYREKNKNTKEMIDVQGAYVYKNIAAKYPKSVILSLVLNTDGAQQFKSTRKSLWPIQLYQNYLPPSMRYVSDNILVVGLFFGEKKPNVSQFFLPFARESQRIFKNNGLSVVYNNEKLNLLPLVTHCSCDLPAKSMVQELIQYNGFNACGYCMHPGVSIKNNSVNKSSTVRYTRQENENINLRSHEDMLRIMKQIVKRKNSEPIDGIKNLSCMIGFKNFDLVHGFAIDYMHCVLLGVMKTLFNLWLNSSCKEIYRISNDDLKILDQRILAIKPTSNITRKPRSIILERANFKANEYRSLLLYYLRYCLPGLLPMDFVHHFQLLSASIYLLLQDTISEDEIAKAENMLIRFADEFETKYGKNSVTMNVHLLRHISNAVRNLGPLWAQSVFGFETNNGVLVQSANGSKRLVEEMAEKYILKRTLALLQNKENQQIIDSTSCIFTGNGKLISLTDVEQSTFNKYGIELELNGKIHAWNRMIFNGNIYTSIKYKETSSIDYFVKFNDISSGIVQFFFNYNNVSYALVEKFKLCVNIDHLQEVESTSKFSIQKISDIYDKLMFMQINNRKIVTRIPNYHEKT